MLLDGISEQTISTPQMDASKVSVSYDETRIDHVWRRRLENTLKNNVRTATLKEALRPLAILKAINMEDLMTAVDGQSGVWNTFLYSPTSGFNLPK